MITYLIEHDYNKPYFIIYITILKCYKYIY